ncbi:MAG TPA: MYXO-CTERM sorting domain-containing protein [Kofleriaceae bacterium]|nr:MYXO-CTERM sorting domain-containing protein [Kofleriaceae bacterium]
MTDTTTPVDLTLDSTTVLCSSADYGALFLKVLIPDLARLTLLDHQNIGAGAPCVASGQCKPGNMPANIIVAGDPIERVDVNVKEVRLDEADSVAMTCNTTLIEKVQVTIRGIQFFHQRELPLGSRPFSDCATSASTGGGSGSGSGSDTGSGSDSGSGSVGSGSDDKSDDYGGADDPKTGGCDASTGSAGLTFGMIALGAALARRRRRA